MSKNWLLLTKKVYNKTIKTHLTNSNKNLTIMVSKYGFDTLQQNIKLPTILAI